jgi:cytidine deaminase
MRQILGVADNSSILSGTLEIPQYTLSPPRSPSASTSLIKSLKRGLSDATLSQSVNTPFQSHNDGTRKQLTGSHSFASLLGQGQPDNSRSAVNSSFIIPSTALSFPQTQAKPSNFSGTQDINSAALIYNSHFSGLESYGASGMTILEELMDLSLRVCENGRIAGQKHNSRGAALLTSNGKVYSGCDINLEGNTLGISAERAAVIAAVADGSSVFHCLVLSTDTMTVFPAPDGQSREFLRSFGVFPVIQSEWMHSCILWNWSFL